LESHRFRRISVQDAHTRVDQIDATLNEEGMRKIVFALACTMTLCSRMAVAADAVATPVATQTPTTQPPNVLTNPVGFGLYCFELAGNVLSCYWFDN
jgi:predicted lipoprotein with Yx(FWY)xxD motif